MWLHVPSRYNIDLHVATLFYQNYIDITRRNITKFYKKKIQDKKKLRVITCSYEISNSNQSSNHM